MRRSCWRHRNCGEFIRRLIWPTFKSYFLSKNISSQTLYILLFYIDKILTVTEDTEVEKLIYPFFIKCLMCNNLKIQKLSFARLTLIIDKLQTSELKKQLFLNLISFLKSPKPDLLLLNLKFIHENISLFDKEIVGKQLFDELSDFYANTKEEDYQLFDLIFQIMQQIYSLKDVSDKVGL